MKRLNNNKSADTTLFTLNTATCFNKRIEENDIAYMYICTHCYKYRPPTQWTNHTYLIIVLYIFVIFFEKYKIYSWEFT